MISTSESLAAGAAKGRKGAAETYTPGGTTPEQTHIQNDRKDQPEGRFAQRDAGMRG